MPSTNQRRYPRRESSLPARVEFSWGEIEGTIENIGEGGVFFVTETLEGRVEPEDRAHVRFEGERVPGTVVRVERYFHDGRVYRALAVRFDTPLSRPDPTESGD